MQLAVGELPTCPRKGVQIGQSLKGVTGYPTPSDEAPTRGPTRRRLVSSLPSKLIFYCSLALSELEQNALEAIQQAQTILEKRNSNLPTIKGTVSDHFCQCPLFRRRRDQSDTKGQWRFAVGTAPGGFDGRGDEDPGGQVRHGHPLPVGKHRHRRPR